MSNIICRKKDVIENIISSFRNYFSKHNLLTFIQILKFMHLGKEVFYSGLQ